MKILIATGIFKPELGGPATLAAELGKRFQASGHKVTVVTYSPKSEFPFDQDYQFRLIRLLRTEHKIVNYCKFFFAMLREIKKHDVIYTLDWFSAGFPVMLAAWLMRKKYIVRVGGGYLWEKYLAEGKTPVSLKEFYAKGLHTEYKFMYFVIKQVLQRAAFVIFNSDEQRTLYREYYNLLEEATVTIYNAIPENRLSGLVQSYNTNFHDRDKEFVFAGRFIKMKNVESLIKAFAELKDPTFKLILIGEGPLEKHLHDEVARLHLSHKVEFLPAMNQSDLYRRVAHCYAVVIPSWTDVSPNQAYECLALGIPFLITKENYLSIHDQIPQMIDPHSVSDIANKMNALLDETTYKDFVQKLQAIEFNHPWSYVVEEHLKVFMKYNRM